MVLQGSIDSELVFWNDLLNIGCIDLLIIDSKVVVILIQVILCLLLDKLVTDGLIHNFGVVNSDRLIMIAVFLMISMSNFFERHMLILNSQRFGLGSLFLDFELFNTVTSKGKVKRLLLIILPLHSICLTLIKRLFRCNFLYSRLGFNAFLANFFEQWFQLSVVKTLSTYQSACCHYGLIIFKIRLLPNCSLRRFTRQITSLLLLLLLLNNLIGTHFLNSGQNKFFFL